MKDHEGSTPGRARCRELANAAVEMTAEIIDRFGPRVSGTEGNRAARDDLLGRLAEVCPTTRREAFRIHPDSLFAIGKVFTVAYLVGMTAALVGTTILMAVALSAMALGLVYFIAQFILYLSVFDPLFKGAEAENLVGVIEPEGQAERQVVLVGHHDSAPVYPFHERTAILYPIRLFAPILLYLACAAILAFRLATLATTGIDPGVDAWLEYVLAGGLLVVLPMFGFMSKRGSPGAADNLIGCAIALQVAKAVRGKLAGTRVIVLFTDGEEVGQKGAAAFARMNDALLRGVPSRIINIETICDYSELTIIERDRNGFSAMSKETVEGLRTVAADLGLEFAVKPIPFLGGGTDAGQFARAGHDVACIVGMSVSAFRRDIVFHTSRDRPDRISREAVGATIELVREYIIRTYGTSRD